MMTNAPRSVVVSLRMLPCESKAQFAALATRWQLRMFDMPNTVAEPSSSASFELRDLLARVRHEVEAAREASAGVVRRNLMSWEAVMPKRVVRSRPLGGGDRDMALDIVSHGRRGPGGVLRFGPAQIQQIQRTVGRTPEVMVKVSGGGRDCGGVAAHLKYIARHGKLSLETDEGQTVLGREAAQEIVQDWSLDLCRSQYRPKPAEGQKDTRSKLVHNIVLSMPAGTPPEKVLAAARVFARENFGLQHRYAMALHTDQAHPHVHLVVKCEHEYEPGRRLYVRKDTLRRWREQFAELMREQGVAANATPRQIRGQVRRSQRDAIHHRLRAMRAFGQLDAMARSQHAAPKPSTFMRDKVLAMVSALKSEANSGEANNGAGVLAQGKDTLQGTRDAVCDDWQATMQTLRRQGQRDLAAQVERFMAQMPPVRTDGERLAEQWRGWQRTPTPERSRPRAPEERSRGVEDSRHRGPDAAQLDQG